MLRHSTVPLYVSKIHRQCRHSRAEQGDFDAQYATAAADVPDGASENSRAYALLLLRS